MARLEKEAADVWLNATSETAKMKSDHEQVLNYRGARYFTPSGHPRRRHRTAVDYKGRQLWVEYEADGYYAPATDVDDACYPTCNIKTVELATHGRAANGEWVSVLVDVTELMEGEVDEIAERVEREWRGEV